MVIIWIIHTGSGAFTTHTFTILFIGTVGIMILFTVTTTVIIRAGRFQ